MTTLTRSHQIFVHAPLQPAFDYLSDLTRHPEWSGGLKIEPLTPGPIAVGKEYRSQGEVAVQKDRPNTVRISRYEPPHTFGFIARDPSFGEVSHVFTLAGKDDSVLITRTMTVNLNILLAFLFRFFIYPLIGRPSMDKSLTALQARLEQMFPPQSG